MITVINRKTLDAINRKTLDSISDGAKTMRDGAKIGAGIAMKHARRVEFRTPWIYRKSIGKSSPWLFGIVIFSSIAAVVGGILYFRKRKQVAERYTMGGPEGSGDWDASRPKDETLASANP